MVAAQEKANDLNYQAKVIDYALRRMAEDPVRMQKAYQDMVMLSGQVTLDDFKAMQDPNLAPEQRQAISDKIEKAFVVGYTTRAMLMQGQGGRVAMPGYLGKMVGDEQNPI